MAGPYNIHRYNIRRPSPDYLERPEPKIREAVERDDVIALTRLLELEKSRKDDVFFGRLLKLALLRSAEVGNLSTIKLALQFGAKTDALPSRQSPLLRAILCGHHEIVPLLVDAGASVNERDRNGRTPLMIAALRYDPNAVDLLLYLGADVDIRDEGGKTVLHHVAAEPLEIPAWGFVVLRRIIQTTAQIDAKDANGRTVLHWACAMGKERLAHMLLSPETGKRADISMTESLSRTPLHLAVSHGHKSVVSLLLTYGADVNAQSAGGWTPLHIACQRAKLKQYDPGLVQTLLDNGALVNVQTTSGETPLHLAAESGVPGVVESLLRCADIRLDIRDEYGDTPFSKAAKAKSTHALHLLAPYRAERVPKKELDASKTFKAMIVDFGRFPNGKRRIEMTMHDLLYSQTPVRAPDLTARPRPLLLPKLSKSRLSPKMHQAIHFRWIHLPANNIAWAEALLTKAFVEEGDYDFDKFMAVERSIETLQRSQKFESHYMRPSCDPITGDEAGSSFTAKPKPPDPKAAPEISPGPPLVVVNYGTTDEDLPDERTRRKGKKESSQGAGRETVTEEPPRSRSRRRRRGATEPIESDSEQPSKMSKSAQLAARHPQKKKKPKPNSSPPAPPVEPLPPYAMDDSSVFLLMPYVHFEQGRDLPSMEKTIQSALMTNPEATRMMLNTSHLYKEELNHRRSHSRNDFDIWAMTFYRKLNSSKEAVVQKDSSRAQGSATDSQKNLSLYMVGQLCMWILSDDLIITCLPQQWDAPRDDHLNVLEGIIKDIKNRSKETVPVRSVIDLACIISSRCIDAIESRVVKEKDYPFLDKFESTVSSIDQQVDELFRQFNVDSRQASEWLKRQRVRSHPSPNPSDDDLNITGDPDEPECVDRLLDINPETKLLDQIQSLRDEFQLLTSVLSSQTWGVNEFLEKLRISPQETKELNSYASEQLATIRTHLSDIDRMQAQTNAIHASITNLLDLKQRYANVFEARFARYQATDTVHQGQTIMVFTIVTVIFLPLSFIGSLFTINISDFPQGPDGEPSMSFAFVAKWVFGIGFAISVPLVLLALSYESMTRAARERKRRIWAKWRGRKVRGTTAATTTTAPLKEADWKEVVDATAVAPQVDHEDWQEIRRAAPRDSWTMTMYKGFRRKRRFGAFAGERGV